MDFSKLSLYTVSFNNVVFYSIIILSLHLLFKRLIDAVFGISFGYVNPFTLSIHGLRYTPARSKDVHAEIKKVKFGFSIFTRSKAYFRVSLVDFIIDLENLQLDGSDNSSDTNKRSPSKCDANELFQKMQDKGFNPDDPVSLYAGDKKLGRLFWFILRYLPHLSFKVYNTQLLLSQQYKVVVTIMEGQTDVSKTNTKVSVLKSSKNLVHTWASYIHASGAHLLKTDTGDIVSKFFDQCVASFTLQIDIKTGNVESLEPTFRLSGIEVSVLFLLRAIKSINPNFTLVHDESSSAKSVGSKKVKVIPKYKFVIYGLLIRMLKNASVTLHSIVIKEMPLARPERVQKYLQTNSEKDLENIIFVKSDVASLTLNVGPISPNQVGYSLKFVEDSFPIQWHITVSSFKLSLDFNKMIGYSGKIKFFDVIAIPNLLFTMESTMMVNLLRVLFNDDVQENFVKTQTITTVQFTVANPSIDISVEQLVLLMKTSQSNMICKIDNLEESSSVSISESDKNRKKRYLDTFLETSPKFQIRFLIEKPMAIIRSDTELKEERDLHMIIFQPSLVGIQFNSNTKNKNMHCDFTFTIPETSVIYQRNNQNKSSVTFIELHDLLFKTSCKLLEINDMRISVGLSGFTLDVTSLEALNGIGIILNSLELHMLKNKTPKQVTKKSNENLESIANSLFHNLPSWFTAFTVELKNITLILGSKSLFLPPETLLEENDEFNSITEDGCHAPSRIKFKIHEIGACLKKPGVSIVSDDSTSTEASEKSRLPDQYYWNIPGVIKGINLQTSMQNPNFDIKQTEKVLSVPDIQLNAFCLKSGIFEISNNIDMMKIDHSVTSHFALFSAFYLIKTSIYFHREDLFPELLQLKRAKEDASVGISLKKMDSPETNSNLKNKGKRFSLLHVKWYIKEFQFKMLMPGLFNARLDLYDVKGLMADNNIVMEKKLVRLSVKKSIDYSYYNKILSLDNMRIVCHLPDLKHKIASILIFDSNVKITIPSNFVVHSLFDAIILTAKLTKKFIATIKNGPSMERDRTTASGVINLPKISLKSASLSMKLEDDPFESDLGMIYQLGLLEQKVRLEKYKLFDNLKEKLKDDIASSFDQRLLNQIYQHLDGLDYLGEYRDCRLENSDARRIVNDFSKKFHKLKVNISKSWIKIVEEYKMRKKKTLNENVSFLTGVLSTALPVSKSFNTNIIDFDENPPLMSILLNDVIISVKPPKFKKDNGDVHEYLYRVGKGVPKDTVWDKIVPMQMSIRASEVRVHLRDFPMPLAYIPNSRKLERWSDSFVMKATLVIAEAFPQTDDEYWYLYIPMFNDMNRGDEIDKFYSWDAPKTITSVKAYYEVDCDINSDASTLGTWSTAYQDVLRQLNLTFDTFSKVTKDPSPKLGTWDKLRNILHGYVKLNWTNPDSDVRINILNSSDPYRIVDFNAGFSLLFKYDVQWLINDPERELERDYFIFRSKRIVFGVPNFLAEPLPSWCSKSLVFIPAGDASSLVSSLYGYYLNTDLYFEKNPDAESMYQRTREFRYKTANIDLHGDLELKISMTFERILEDGKVTREFKSHFDNILTNPDRVGGDHLFDSYKGFRSDYIHMALNLTTSNSTYNVLRLTPITLSWFIKWFKRFSDDPSLPIRTGSLWETVPQSVKMGSHVMTFKFKFDVSPLYIYHGHRSDLVNPDVKTSIGLKAKIKSFKCDLHERKEKKVKKVEFLNQSHEIMHMTFYIGKVELSEIDLRAIGLKFEKSSSETPKHRFEIFDNDENWIDILDYEEVSLPTLKNADVNGQIYPLLYASHFCYWMNKNATRDDDVSDFGHEDSHDCLIEENEFPDIPYNHVFDINSLKLKWNCAVRNLIFEFLFEVSFRSAYIYSTSFRATRAIYEKIESTKRNSKDQPEKTQRKIADIEINNQEDFENMMNDVSRFGSSATAVNDMMIRLDDVQAQLMINSNDDSLILMRTQHNEVRIVSIMDEDWYKYIEAAFICKRFGTIFEDADLLIINKGEYEALGKCASHYGTTGSWPVFLSGEEPEAFVKDKTLLSDVLIYFGYEKASSTYSARSSRDKLYLNVPKFETKIDSQSYFTSFKIVNEVLNYSSKQQKQFAQMIQAISLATGDNIDHMYTSLEKICGEVQSIVTIHNALSPYRYAMTDELMVDSMIRQELSKHFTNALLLSKTLLLACDPEEGGGEDDCYLEWIIRATHVNVEFIEDGQSFLSFTLQDSVFSRLEMIDRSSQNQITINGIEIINKDYNILYPVLLSSYNLDKKMCGVNVPDMKESVRINWEIGDKVGGMPLIKDVNIMCHPMKLSIEEKTGFKLMKFLFPNEAKYQNGTTSSSDEDSALLFEDEEDDNEYGADYSDDNLNGNTSNSFHEGVTGSGSESILDSADSSLISYEPNMSTEKSATPLSSDSKIPDSKMNGEGALINGSTKMKGSTLRKGNLKPDLKCNDESDGNSDSERVDVESILNQANDLKDVSSNMTKGSKASNSIKSRYSSRLNKKITTNMINTNEVLDNLLKFGVKSSAHEIADNAEEMMEISERAKKFFIIQKLVFHDFVLNISFSGSGKFRLLNVSDLLLTVPRFSVTKKLWGSIDLVNAIKKHFIKTILKQSGRLLKNKLFVFRRKKRVNKLSDKIKKRQ